MVNATLVASSTSNFSAGQFFSYIDWMFDQTPSNVTSHSFVLAGTFGGLPAMATVTGNFTASGGNLTGGTILGITMRLKGLVEGSVATNLSVAPVFAAVAAE